jgi:tripartite-type tricarboxylate transporter receptor subunit TctC
VHIAYKGTGPALQDLLGGQVQFMGASIGVGKAMHEAGRVRALAVMSAERLAGAPSIPTATEAGLPLEVGTWNVVMAPVGTPAPIVAKLNQAINKVLAEPAIQERLTGMGISPIANSTPESTAQRVASEIEKWAKAFEISGAEKQ